MKTSTWKLSAALCAGLTLVLVCGTRADDSVPPCWRGNPGTTCQNWSFAVSNNPASPEAFTNPNGMPQATFTPGSFATGWKAGALGRNGLWDLGKGGQVSLAVPDSAGSPTPWKYVQVQVTYFDAPGFYLPPTTSLAGATLVSSQVVSNQAYGPGVWRTQVTLWLLQLSPGAETIVLNGDPAHGLVLDQIIIDTRCPVAGAGEVAAYRPCWRGQPGTTFQQWMFGAPSSSGSLSPEFASNAFGSATATLALGAFSSGFIEEEPFLGCRQGIWDLGQSGIMTLSIPNNPAASGTAYRYVTVAVTEYQDALYDASASVSVAGGALVSRQEQPVEETAFGQWVVEQTVWRLEPPRPGSESVVITGGENGSLIDQVVVDTLELDFAAPADIVASADPGQCSKAQVSWSLPAVDGCVVTNVVCTPATGATFWVGTNLVSALVQDGEGGSQSLNFRVIVTDNEAPTLACPANLVVPKEVGQCGAVVSFSPTPLDNCSGATVISVPASGSFFPLGLTAVTCSARDGAGNVSSPCTFQVRVVDFTGDVPAYRPCWRGQPGSTFQQWAFSVSNNPALMAAELVTNRFGAPQASIVPGPFSAGYIDQDAFLGCHQGIWDLGENGTMSLSISNNPAASETAYRYVAVQVTQYRDGSVYTTNAWVAIAGGTLVSRQEQPVEETAFGQWVVEQTVWRLEPPRPGSESVVVTGGENGSLIDQVVVDTLELDFAAPTDIVASADPGQCSKAHVSWSLPAVDGCVVTNVVCTPATGVTFWVGTNLVSALVQDGEGGSRSLNFRVIITDNEAPVARCHDLTVTLNGAGLATITGADIDNGSTDNCGILSLMVNPSSFTLANLGPNSVVLTAMDVHGHIATCNATVTVVAGADLSVALASSANPAPLGTNLVYTVTVSNAGPGTATGVVLTNYLSGGQVGFAVTNGVSGIGQGCPFPGPVSWWPAEGNATDAVDGNSGTVAGGVTYVAGRVGQAFGFDGLTGSVTVPDKPALRPSSLTLEGWIKVKDVTGVHVVIGKRVGTDTADSYSLWLGSGVLFAAMADDTGSGPFLTYPEFPASSLFTAGDIVDLQPLALGLRAAADPVSQFLKAGFSAPTLALLNAYAGGSAPALEEALLKDLNVVIQHGSIYTPERFAAVTLSPESTYILGRHPSGADLVRLNRFLVRDAYPGDFLASVFPQLDRYFHVAYTFDAASQVQALYVDGALVNSSFVNKTIAYDGHPVMIGADDNHGSPGYFYQGEVDEMTLYNRALTGTEIRAIAQAGSAGKCPTPGLVQLGSLASGATAQVSLVATPTNCSPVFASVAVSATTVDTKLLNNVAAVSVPVQDLPAGQLRLRLEPVSVNNNLLRVSWPLTCNPFVFESALGVQAPVLWSPDAVPVQMIGDLHSVIVPATNSAQYYRVRLP